MALSNPAAPTATLDAFAAAISDFLSPPSTATEGYVGPRPAIPASGDIGTPDVFRQAYAQQVFVLGLADAAANTGIGAAVPAGWRFFAGDASGKVVLGRVAQSQAAGGWKLTAVHYSDRVWTALQQSRALDALPQLQGGDYELRVLTVPGLNLEAFWLAGKSPGASDLVVPFPVSPNQPIGALNQQSVYSMADFLAAIQPLAYERTKDPKSYGG